MISVDNTMGNIEKKNRQNVYQYLLAFPQYFQRPFFFRINIFLPNNKFLDWFKSKPFAGDNLTVGKMSKFVFDRGEVENIVGKGEILVSSIFSCSHYVLKRLFFKGL